MEKVFNTTGLCVPEKHYMVDISGKLEKIFDMMKSGKYFTITRPRQFGKTTTIYLLKKRLLREEYLPISISFEGIGEDNYENEELFIKALVYQFKKTLKSLKEQEMLKFIDSYERISMLSEFDFFITDLIQSTKRRIVLLIDEVNKSSDNKLFLDFLGVLRNKYLLRTAGEDVTFHSVVLAGVHDIRTLKLKLRPDDQRKYNSPWNIASNFNVDMSFSISEIATMLEEYKCNKATDMDVLEIAERIYFYTSGYPFLVSRLCQIIDEDMEVTNTWLVDDVEKSVRIILKENNPNFEDLIKNIENNEELSDFVQKIAIDGELIPYVGTDVIISLGGMYGILKSDSGVCKINNKIYELLIYDHLMLKITRRNSSLLNYNFRDKFIIGNVLNMEKLLLKFQEFTREQYSSKDQKFLEREGRLVLLAFIKPIINGEGFDFKEVQISEEKRLDVVITFHNKKYVLELKRWQGDKAHEKGLRQLAEYLDLQGLGLGYLVIFDFSKDKGKNIMAYRTIVENKEIFMVRV